MCKSYLSQGCIMIFYRQILVLALSLSTFANPSLALAVESEGTPHKTFKQKIGKVFKGVASWYGGKFHGRRTASGTIYNKNELTCAHRTLPFGTNVQVTNPENGAQCNVKVTDRGPFHGKRIIDLSKAAARKLGITGVARVICKTGNRRTIASNKHEAKTNNVAKQETETGNSASVEPAPQPQPADDS